MNAEAGRDPLAQLALVHEFAAERAQREDIYPFMRESGQVFTDLLANLLGGRAISDADLEAAIASVRAGDDATAQAIVRRERGQA